MNIEKVLANYKRHGFGAVYFESAAEAADYLADKIRNTTVGFGGCMTARQMGLYELLGRENEVIWHWETPGDETLEAAANTKVYIMSANGASETGELANIDGNCNRLASSLMGHDAVYVIIGTNKLEPTCEAAISRARNIASPLNARRLGAKTPCAVGELKCHDCDSEARICGALTVLWRKPGKIKNMEVVIIGENLGF